MNNSRERKTQKKKKMQNFSFAFFFQFISEIFHLSHYERIFKVLIRVKLFEKKKVRRKK